MTIEYVKGRANPAADALSRGFLPKGEELEETCDENENVVYAIYSQKDSKWLVELRSDPVYGPVIVSLEKGVLDDEVRLPGAQKKYKVADFVFEDGQLKLLHGDGSAVLVVLHDRRKAVFDENLSGLMAGHHPAPKAITEARLLGWNAP